MKITPLDMQQKQFARRWNGYDANDVEAFLRLCATEFEEVIKENISLKEEARRKDKRIAEYREHEQTLQETMVTAQRMTAEIKEQARKEADIRLGEAEIQAEKITQTAQSRVVQIISEIDELKRQRALFASQLVSLIQGHQRLLETFVDEARRPQVEDNVAFMKPASKQGA